MCKAYPHPRQCATFMYSTSHTEQGTACFCRRPLSHTHDTPAFAWFVRQQSRWLPVLIVLEAHGDKPHAIPWDGGEGPDAGARLPLVQALFHGKCCCCVYMTRRVRVGQNRRQWQQVCCSNMHQVYCDIVKPSSITLEHRLLYRIYGSARRCARFLNSMFLSVLHKVSLMFLLGFVPGISYLWA